MSRESSGIIPNRCARNSSVSTEVFVSISTRSIATVGNSANIILRREFAKLLVRNQGSEGKGKIR